MPQGRHVSTLQHFRVDVKKFLSLQGRLHSPRFLKVNQVIDRHLKLRHDASRAMLEVATHEVSAQAVLQFPMAPAPLVYVVLRLTGGRIDMFIAEGRIVFEPEFFLTGPVDCIPT